MGTSLALAYVSVAWVVLYNGDRWFGTHWIARSNVAMAITLVLVLLAALFILWSIYLLIRFAIAFAKAARALKRKWKADDASAISA